MANTHKKRDLITAFCGVVLSLLFGACSEVEEQKKDYRFEILDPAETGITFSNDLKNNPERNILNYIYYYNGGGVAAGDFNNDGLVDLYFTANEGPNALYLNKGDLKFDEIAEAAGVLDSEGWSTGVTTVDINQDGYLDLYVSKVEPLASSTGGNKLFINQGKTEDNIPRFTEQAAQFGLDFKGYSTQASFFDYDLDGDLDMFLMNHTVNPNSNYGRGSKRKQIDTLSGDRLYVNVDGFYQNKSEETGILQSPIGYGLGLGVGYLNSDRLPDIYVGNDFFENDYLYINNKSGVFSEQISSSNNPLGHTSHYTMGLDMGDLNNDGLTDILSVDMLPEDLQTYKSSGVEFGYSTYSNYLRNGYAPQYMQNALHFNQGNMRFSETAYLSGVEATEWSWAPLIADFDNDGLKDIFISNGIVGATNDMDFINFIADESIQQRLGKGMTKEDMAFVEKIPEKKTVNYFYKNDNGRQFSYKSTEWVDGQPSFSNGSIYADLDNDGDLDIVSNNVNQPATVYKNLTREKDSTNYIQIHLLQDQSFATPTSLALQREENSERTLPQDSLKRVLAKALNYDTKNLQVIGATVSVYSSSGVQHKDLFTTRGYQSAVDTRLHFGLGRDTSVDSIIVHWPDLGVSITRDLKVNRIHTIIENETFIYEGVIGENQDPCLEVVGLDLFTHKENASLEFNWDPLIAYASTNEGPDVAVADVNGDGRQDAFFCGAKGQSSVLMLQDNKGGFYEYANDTFPVDALAEDTAAVFADLNGDQLPDLIVGSGGNEFTNGKAIQPRLYWNDPDGFYKDETAFEGIFVNASSISAVDFDCDGDLDLSISSDGIAKQFGSSATQYLLRNEGDGKFKDVTQEAAPDWVDLGKVKEIVWEDFNDDGWPDALVVGHWMPLQLYLNNNGMLELQDVSAFKANSGLWETAAVADFDADGDLDILAGNWGLNSRLTATIQDPLRLYRGDFNGNGSNESLITYNYRGQEILLPSKDELAKQIPQINKDYLSYASFAQATTRELFSEELWNAAQKKEVTQLATTYFENLGNGNFNTSSAPFTAQISPVNDIFVNDFNADGFPDVLLVGNRTEVSTQIGRLDGSKGTILLFDPEDGFTKFRDAKLNLNGSCRAIEQITINNQPHLIITRNDDAVIVLEIINDVIQTPNE